MERRAVTNQLKSLKVPRNSLSKAAPSSGVPQSCTIYLLSLLHNNAALTLFRHTRTPMEMHIWLLYHAYLLRILPFPTGVLPCLCIADSDGGIIH